MRKLIFLILALLSISVLPTTTLAQRNNGDPAAACGMMGCSIVIWLIMMIVIIGAAVAVIVFIFKWIKKDALARGAPNASSVPWLALLGLMGLLIYVLTRPQGNLFPCQRCGKPRMQGLPQCPNCRQP